MGDLNAAVVGVGEESIDPFAIQCFGPLKAEPRAFLCMVCTDEVVPVRGEVSLATLQLAHALVEAGQTPRIIQV